MPDATIYDVAERAGVSISTVWRVLNAPDQVNEAMRTRVLAAIHELGFVPKAEAVARACRAHAAAACWPRFSPIHRLSNVCVE
jgi:DNA-binding LacI/PurR family transcriptional regulator